MTIREKQAFLLILGYYVGEVDGDWGTLTKSVVGSVSLWV